ncbi:hypothetical protein ACFX2F_009596 [Malus domestica]
MGKSKASIMVADVSDSELDREFQQQQIIMPLYEFHETVTLMNVHQDDLQHHLTDLQHTLAEMTINRARQEKFQQTVFEELRTLKTPPFPKTVLRFPSGPFPFPWAPLLLRPSQPFFPNQPGVLHTPNPSLQTTLCGPPWLRVLPPYLTLLQLFLVIPPTFVTYPHTSTTQSCITLGPPFHPFLPKPFLVNGGAKIVKDKAHSLL